MQNDTEFTPANTIYLNYLPYGGGPSDFQEIIAAIKQSLSREDCEQVDEVKVRDRRDRPDSYSVYALVRFKSPEIVARLIKGTLTISGKPIKVESYAGEREYHIYIKSTHALTPEQIRKHFSQFGQVAKSVMQIECDHNYTSEDHNSCLLRFVRQEDAEKCLQNHEHNIEGTRLWLERYISKEQRHEEYHRLFLNKIPVKADNRTEIENLITEEMSKYGKLVRKIEVELKETQPKFGHCIVYFATQAQAEEARQKFNRNLLSSYGSEPLELDNFISKKDRDNKGQLYVSDLLPNTDQNYIRELFEKYGKVDAVALSKYSHPQKGVSCLRGTITFEDKNSINEVLSEAYKDKPLCAIFLDEQPRVNIYMNRQERQQFSKTVKKGRPQQPPPMSMPFPPQGMIPNLYGMQPFMMPPQMGAPFNPTFMPMPGFMPPQMPTQRRE